MQQIAQLNVARMKFEFDDPKMKEFIDRLDDINTLAGHAAGARAFTFKQSFPAG